jgi:ribosome-binding ATPase YchF (GTP1/OBG family)
VRLLWTHGTPLDAALAAGTALAAVMGLVIGAPALRLRGPYFAIGTLAVAEILRITAGNVLPDIAALPPEALDRAPLSSYGFLTDRPLLAVVNRGESEAAQPLGAPLEQKLAAMHAAGLVLSASVEAEIARMDAADQAAFLEDLGLEESALARFIHTAYRLLDLISFFTVGPDEVRAWPIRRGTKAKGAAGKIHTDLERGFIRTEVMPYDVFMQYGSEQAVHHAGKLQVEGKDYVVADGDILHIRFNV